MPHDQPNQSRETTAWAGNWRTRLDAQLRQLGHTSLDDFLSANPGVGYIVLSKLLSSANVAPMQIYNEHLRLGLETGNFRNVTMDCLVRFLNDYLRRGWRNGKHFAHRSASAFAAWSTSVLAHTNSDANMKEVLNEVFVELESLPIPTGWRPKYINDEFIKQAFSRAWPNIRTEKRASHP